MAAMATALMFVRSSSSSMKLAFAFDINASSVRASGLSTLTHVDQQGKAAMVDVSQKTNTVRSATARAVVHLTNEAYKAVHNNEVKKGDVLGVAKLAGIMAAKATSNLIPLCHPIEIRGCDVNLHLSEPPANDVVVNATVRTVGATGVEMEAMTAASVASLTVYDMVKGIDKGVKIGEVKLIHKSGGKSGEWHAEK
ncbi:hypothetical protein PPROV_000558800 [Pycnococcus provasolii]|uniref:cyclic pyranopterin monophosphate synthase n=1 Tax=Pycnococcus provasolii TaxID=41880 RepID=A0A830HI90_9CHLO|nr:hypothetical protein PPROV_000558800 [Pycnococcus provasolii]